MEIALGTALYRLFDEFVCSVLEERVAHTHITFFVVFTLRPSINGPALLCLWASLHRHPKAVTKTHSWLLEHAFKNIAGDKTLPSHPLTVANKIKIFHWKGFANWKLLSTALYSLDELPNVKKLLFPCVMLLASAHMPGLRIYPFSPKFCHLKFTSKRYLN